MSLDIVQLGFKLLKNLEKVIFFTLGLAWVIMSMTLVIKFSSSDQGGVITEVEMPRGEVVESTEGQAQWQDYAGRLKDPEKFSAYEEYKKIARKGIFKPEKKREIAVVDDKKIDNIPLPDEALAFRFDKVIIAPFPIKYMGMFKIGDKLTAQINWGSDTKFVSEQDKIKQYTVNKISQEEVEVEDAGGKKVILPYKQQIYNEELKAALSVTYTKDVISQPKEELNGYTVTAGQLITSDKYTIQAVKITENDITLKVKYKIKQQIKVNTDTDTAAKKEIEIEKEEVFVLKLNETKVIDLTIEKKTESGQAKVNIAEEQDALVEKTVAVE